MDTDKNLLFFYGDDCPHCVKMDKIVNQLVGEGFVFKKIEVWNNKENDKFLLSLDCGDDECGGVPFFFNENNGKKLCGEVSYKEMKDWAEGK